MTTNTSELGVGQTFPEAGAVERSTAGAGGVPGGRDSKVLRSWMLLPLAISALVPTLAFSSEQRQNDKNVLVNCSSTLAETPQTPQFRLPIFSAHRVNVSGEYSHHIHLEPREPGGLNNLRPQYTSSVLTGNKVEGTLRNISPPTQRTLKVNKFGVSDEIVLSEFERAKLTRVMRDPKAIYTVRSDFSISGTNGPITVRFNSTFQARNFTSDRIVGPNFLETVVDIVDPPDPNRRGGDRLSDEEVMAISRAMQTSIRRPDGAYTDTQILRPFVTIPEKINYKCGVLNGEGKLVPMTGLSRVDIRVPSFRFSGFGFSPVFVP